MTGVFTRSSLCLQTTVCIEPCHHCFKSVFWLPYLALCAAVMSTRFHSPSNNAPRVAMLAVGTPTSADVPLLSQQAASLFLSSAFSLATADFLSHVAVAAHWPVPFLPLVKVELGLCLAETMLTKGTIPVSWRQGCQCPTTYLAFTSCWMAIVTWLWLSWSAARSQLCVTAAGARWFSALNRHVASWSRRNWQ